MTKRRRFVFRLRDGCKSSAFFLCLLEANDTIPVNCPMARIPWFGDHVVERNEPDNARADVAVVAALPLEIDPLLARCERVRKTVSRGVNVHGGWLEGRRLAVVEMGTGLKRVRRALKALIDGHSPRIVLVVGLAGALDPQLSFGQIVVADEVVSLDGNRIEILSENPQLAACVESDKSSRNLAVGRLLTVDRIVRTAEEKAQLFSEHAALAVDMETGIVGQVCHQSEVECFAAIRVISDDAATDLPPEVASLFGASRFFRVGAAFGAVWNRPESAKELWQLRQRACAAADHLSDYLQELIPRLV